MASSSATRSAKSCGVDLNAGGGGSIGPIGGPWPVDPLLDARARIDVGGGVGLDLMDPNEDGRLRFDELLHVTDNFRSPENLLCIFDIGINGSFDLNASITILGLTLGTDDLPFPTSFDFEISASDIFGALGFDCDGRIAPILAEEIEDDGSTVLQINAGAYAQNRLFGGPLLPEAGPDVLDADRMISDVNGVEVIVSGTNGNVTVAMPNLRTRAGKLFDREKVTKTFSGTYDRIVVVGDEGNDVFDFSGLTGLPVDAEGAGGDDEITGGGAGDKISGGAGKDTLLGGAGADEIKGGGDDDHIEGGPGNDILLGETGTDTIYGDSKDDASATGDDNMEGGSGPDKMYGGPGNDQMLGGTGNDTMFGGDGADRMFGESGNDTMEGGAGDDEMFGEVGNDNLQTGPGADFADGGVGQDIVSDGSLLERADGTVTIMVPKTGPSDSAETEFEEKTFFVDGDMDSDTLYGDKGGDVVIGGINDFLFGNQGPDKLFVGIGAEWADGGAGTDTLEYNLVHPTEPTGVVVAELRSDRLIGHAITNSAGGTPLTSASNTSPIVITATGHGLKTGDTVKVEGVTGNDGANGDFTITRVDESRFSLNGSKGTGAGTGGTFSPTKNGQKIQRLTDAVTIITEIEEFTSANFGPGPDEFIIAGTPAPLNVTLGAGPDELIVTGTDHTITVDADGGDDTLTIDISADTTARTGWIEPIAGTNGVRVRGLGLLGNGPGETFQGSWDPNSNEFPQGRPISNPGGNDPTIAKDFFIASASGEVDGVTFEVGDVIFATKDDPASNVFAGNWDRGAPVAATNFNNLNVRLGQADDTLTVDKATFFNDHKFFGNAGDDRFFITPDDPSFGNSKPLLIRGDEGDDVADILIDLIVEDTSVGNPVPTDPSLKQWGVDIDTLRIDNSNEIGADPERSEIWELRDRDIFVQDKDTSVHGDAMFVLSALGANTTLFRGTLDANGNPVDELIITDSPASKKTISAAGDLVSFVTGKTVLSPQLQPGGDELHDITELTPNSYDSIRGLKDIATSPDGKFVYITALANIGDAAAGAIQVPSLSVYERDPSTGNLRLIQTLGKAELVGDKAPEAGKAWSPDFVKVSADSGLVYVISNSGAKGLLTVLSRDSGSGFLERTALQGTSRARDLLVNPAQDIHTAYVLHGTDTVNGSRIDAFAFESDGQKIGSKTGEKLSQNDVERAVFTNFVFPVFVPIFQVEDETYNLGGDKGAVPAIANNAIYWIDGNNLNSYNLDSNGLPDVAGTPTQLTTDDNFSYGEVTEIEIDPSSDKLIFTANPITINPQPRYVTRRLRREFVDVEYFLFWETRRTVTVVTESYQSLEGIYENRREQGEQTFVVDISDRKQTDKNNFTATDYQFTGSNSAIAKSPSGKLVNLGVSSDGKLTVRNTNVDVPRQLAGAGSSVYYDLGGSLFVDQSGVQTEFGPIRSTNRAWFWIPPRPPDCIRSFLAPAATCTRLIRRAIRCSGSARRPSSRTLRWFWWRSLSMDSRWPTASLKLVRLRERFSTRCWTIRFPGIPSESTA